MPGGAPGGQVSSERAEDSLSGRDGPGHCVSPRAGEGTGGRGGDLTQPADRAHQEPRRCSRKESRVSARARPGPRLFLVGLQRARSGGKGPFVCSWQHPVPGGAPGTPRARAPWMGPGGGQSPRALPGQRGQGAGPWSWPPRSPFSVTQCSEHCPASHRSGCSQKGHLAPVTGIPLAPLWAPQLPLPLPSFPAKKVDLCQAQTLHLQPPCPSLGSPPGCRSKSTQEMGNCG